MEFILTGKSLCKSFGSNDAAVQAVRDTDIQLTEGNFHVLIGKSGCGKTTLLQLLCGLLKPDAGQIWLNEICYSHLTRIKLDALRLHSFGIIFQDVRLLPEYTVLENILLPSVLGKLKVDEDWQRQLLDALSLEHLLNRFPQELSSGEQRRVTIARAMLQRPRILLADEPADNMDLRTGTEVMNLLFHSSRIWKQTVLLATHNLEMTRYADCLFFMENGKICDRGGCEI